VVNDGYFLCVNVVVLDEIAFGIFRGNNNLCGTAALLFWA
jgi:hypothetical protein